MSQPSLPTPPAEESVLQLMGAGAHRVLGLMLGVLLVALPAMMIGEWLGTGRPVEVAVLGGLAVWFALLTLAHRRQRDTFVLGGLVAAMVAAGALFGVTFGSVRSVGTIALAGAIVVAGIFLGRGALLATLAGGSTVIGALIAAQNQGWLRAPRYEVGIVHWFEYTVVLSAIALSVWFARGVAVDATRRAIKGEAWLGSVLRSAPFALVVSSIEQSRIYEVNAAYERIFRVRREDVIGRTTLELGLWADIADRAPLLEAMRRNGRVDKLPVRFRRADGDVFDALLSAEEVRASVERVMVATVVDVSDEARSRRALQSSEARFRCMFDESPVATAIFTPAEGRIVDCNDAYVALIGRPREAIIGRTGREMGIWRDYADRERAWQVMERIGAVRNQPVELLRADGSSMPCLFNWVFIESGGERLVLTQVVDISAERAAERAQRELAERLEERVQARTAELAASNAALAEARDAAEAATRAKSQFLANMSHEIRTPMNAVVGLTDLALRSPQLTHGVEGYLRNVKRAAMSLLEIINQILDFSKIEAGQLCLEEEPFALDQMLESVRSVVGMAAAAKGLVLHLRLPESLPRQRIGDALRLTQVLINLAGNAVKFTATGEVSLEVADAGPGPDGRERVRFAVQDSGIGIAADKLPRLFQPFDQLDGSMTRRFGGTGLGLAISRELVLRMGGDIEVSSREGVGSRFQFTVPLPCADAAPVASAAAQGESAGPSLRGCRILLAEDNELNQMVARDYLEQVAGARLRIVDNGAAALEALESEDFDVVLMDVQMPVMDGYEATRRLRLDPRHADLPIIAMTAHAQPADRERSREAGMNGHVTKPFDVNELFETLASALRGPRPDRATHATPGPAPVQALRTEVGLQRCMGQADLYRRVLRQYRQLRADDVARLRTALAQGDAATAARVAHDVTSNAATIGAVALARTARRLIQALGPASNPTGAADPALLKQFAAEHAEVLDAVRSELETGDEAG